MIDVPAPLPTCTEVILSTKEAFKGWDEIGHFKNQGQELYVYKTPDTGQGATYIRVLFTPSEADVTWGLKTGWSYNRESLCEDHGVTVYTIVLATKVKERV